MYTGLPRSLVFAASAAFGSDWVSLVGRAQPASSAPALLLFALRLGLAAVHGTALAPPGLRPRSRALRCTVSGAWCSLGAGGWSGGPVCTVSGACSAWVWLYVGFALLFAPRVERLKLEDGGPCFLFITLVWGPASFLIHTLLRWPGQAFDPGIDFGGELLLELLGAAVWSAASLYW